MLACGVEINRSKNNSKSSFFSSKLKSIIVEKKSVFVNMIWISSRRDDLEKEFEI